MLDKRFGTWDDEVNPLIKEARDNLNNMILAQDYAAKGKIDDLFSAVDESRKHATSEFQKIPVTTPEACSYLKNKMDETQRTMSMLLQNTLLTYPRAFQKAPEEVLQTPDDKAQQTRANDESNT